MSHGMLLWHMKSDGACHSHRATAPVTLHGTELSAASEGIATDRLCFVPDNHGDALGALLVPEAALESVTRRGIRLRPGMHPLQHADQLQIGTAVLWISAEAEPDRTTYDPQLHGANVFCARTKARLQPGEAIVVCPGTPSASCGWIYKASAWTPQLVCPRCGFDPQHAPWEPPRRPTTEPSHDLIARIRRKPR